MLKTFFFIIMLIGMHPAFSQDAELVLPYGHQKKITKVIISSDEKTILTASEDHSISAWVLQTGQEIRKFKWHTGAVNDIALSSNNRYLVSVSGDGKALLWNALTGKILKVVPHGYDPVRLVKFAPRTNFFVTTHYLEHSNESVLRFFSIPGCEMVKEFNFADEHILDFVISEKMASVIVLTNKGILYRIDGNTFDRTSSQLGTEGSIGKISDNAATIAISNKYGITLFSNETTTTFRSQIQTTNVSSLAFSPGADTLYATSSNIVYQYNCSTGALLQNAPLPAHGISSLQTSQSGYYVLAGDTTGASFLLSTANLTVLQSYEGRTVAVNKVVFPSGNEKIISLHNDSTVRQWKIANRINLEVLFRTEKNGSEIFGSRLGEPLLLSSQKRLYKSGAANQSLIKISEEENDIVRAIISEDEKWIAVLLKNGQIKTGTYPEYRLGTIIISLTSPARSLAFTNNNRLVYATGNSLYFANPANGQIETKYSLKQDAIRTFAITPDGKTIAVSGIKSGAWIFNAGIDTATAELSTYSIFIGRANFYHQLSLSEDGKLLLAAGPQNIIHLFDVERKTERHSYYGHTDSIHTLQFNSAGTYIFSSAQDHSIKVWPVKLDTARAKVMAAVREADFSSASVLFTKYNPDDLHNFKKPTQPEAATFITFKNNDWIIVTPDRYYFCNKGAAKYLGYSKSGKYFSFEQFDLKYNRPDKVLKAIGVADTALISAYYRAYQKRLKSAGFTEEQLNDDLNLPEIIIKNPELLPSVTDSMGLNFRLEMKDEKFPLKKFQCWVNGVAIGGKEGFPIPAENLKSYLTEIRIALMNGANKIQFAVWNSKGVESYKALFMVQYKAQKKIQPSLYLLAISVSDYRDKRKSLKYAVKDGRDMIKALTKKPGYQQVFIDTLFDKNAIRENILALKKKLMGGSVEDEVVLFVSGHGLLDNNLDFYFATHDVNFDSPNLRGVSFDDLEWLLDGIPQRKKLMLMDACHSGEVDKEEIREAKEGTLQTMNNSTSVVMYAARGSEAEEVESRVGLENSFELMQELFAGLNKGSGTIVISAAAGRGVAYESPDWNNGVFTYSFLYGLRSGEADLNKDKSITALEMLTYVSQMVDQLTKGAQKPTSRRENSDFDWLLWSY